MGVITIPASGMQQQFQTSSGQPRWETIRNLRLTKDGELARSPGWQSSLPPSNPVASSADGTCLVQSSAYTGIILASASTVSRHGSFTATDFADLNGPSVYTTGNPVPVCSVGPVSMATRDQRCYDYTDSQQGFVARAYGQSGDVWEVRMPSATSVPVLSKNGSFLANLTVVTIGYHLCMSVDRTGTYLLIGFSSTSASGNVFKVYNASTGALVGTCTATTGNRRSFLDCCYDPTYDYWVCAYTGAGPEQVTDLEVYAPTGGARVSGLSIPTTFIGTSFGHRVYMCQSSRVLGATAKTHSAGALLPLAISYTVSAGGVIAAGTVITPLGSSGEGLCCVGRPVVQAGDTARPWLPVASVSTASRFDSVIRMGTYSGPLGRWNEGYSSTAQNRNNRIDVTASGLRVYGQRLSEPEAPLGAMVGSVTTRATRAYLVDVSTSFQVLRESAGAISGGVPAILANGQLTSGYPCPNQITAASATSGGSLAIGTYQLTVVEEVQTPRGILRGPVADIVTVSTTTAVSTITVTLLAGRPFGTRGAYRELVLYISFNGSPLLRYGAVDLTSALVVSLMPGASSPMLYSTGVSDAIGGVAPNYQAPSCTAVWTGSDRIACAGVPDYPRDVCFSKLLLASEFPSFPLVGRTSWHVSLPGDVVAVASLQSCWVAWTNYAVFAIYGEGPDDTGMSGGWDTPRQVARIGCSGAQSVTSDGTRVYWQSPGGDIWMMGTDLQPVNVGEAVSHYLQSRAEVSVVAAQWVTGARYNGSTGRVMFLMGSSLVLTFDPRNGSWSEEQVPGASFGGMWTLNSPAAGAECTVLSGGGQWVNECTDPSDTPSTLYPMVAETNDMGAFGPGQTGRFQQFSAMFARPVTCAPLVGDSGTGPATVAVEVWFGGAKPVTAPQSESLVVEGNDASWVDCSTILPGESGVIDVVPSRASARSMRIRFTWTETVIALSQLSLEGEAFGRNQRTGAAAR